MAKCWFCKAEDINNVQTDYVPPYNFWPYKNVNIANFVLLVSLEIAMLLYLLTPILHLLLCI